MDNWNARVGRDLNVGMRYSGKYGEETLKGNEEEQIQFSLRKQLIIGNRLTYQEIKDKYTFVNEKTQEVL